MSEVRRWKLKGFIPGIEGESKAVFQPTVVLAEEYDAALAREAAERLRADVAVADCNEAERRESALREELATSRTAFKEELDGVKYTRRKFRQERDALQQRLTDAERYVQKMVDCSQGQDSIATGYLADILGKLKPV